MGLKVILNADDFGANARVNDAVARCHAEGCLTSASMTVNEPGAEEAAAIARRLPALDVGLHLVLSDGLAAMRGQRTALTGADGRFRRTPLQAGLAYGLNARSRQALLGEIRAQFERFEELGFSAMRVDGHQHMHLHPAVWPRLLEAAAEFGVRAIRVPFEPPLPDFSLRWGRRLEALFLRALRRRCLRTLPKGTLLIPDRVYGHAATGAFSAERLLAVLDRLETPVNEVYFHPGGAGTLRLGGQEEDVETRALLDGRVMERLRRGDIEPATYRGLLTEQWMKPV